MEISSSPGTRSDLQITLPCAASCSAASWSGSRKPSRQRTKISPPWATGARKAVSAKTKATPPNVDFIETLPWVWKKARLNLTSVSASVPRMGRSVHVDDGVTEGLHHVLLGSGAGTRSEEAAKGGKMGGC